MSSGAETSACGRRAPLVRSRISPLRPIRLRSEPALSDSRMGQALRPPVEMTSAGTACGHADSNHGPERTRSAHRIAVTPRGPQPAFLHDSSGLCVLRCLPGALPRTVRHWPPWTGGRRNVPGLAGQPPLTLETPCGFDTNRPGWGATLPIQPPCAWFFLLSCRAEPRHLPADVAHLSFTGGFLRSGLRPPVEMTSAGTACGHADSNHGPQRTRSGRRMAVSPLQDQHARFLLRGRDGREYNAPIDKESP